MTVAESAITAARSAEREVWRQYGLNVVERFIEIDDPHLRVRMLECGSASAEPVVFVLGGLGEAGGWVPGRTLARACSTPGNNGRSRQHRCWKPS